jgi:hypothetical protein
MQTDPPTQIPKLMAAKHPDGTQISDVRVLLLDGTAPKQADFSETCDKDVQKVLKVTDSMVEITQATRELVANEPVLYHWCFYSKLNLLDTNLKKSTTLKAQQEALVAGFLILAPLARNFLDLYQDSRYLRWATSYYQQVSELIFFRKTVLNPEGTLELASPTNPLGIYPVFVGDSSTLKALKIDPTETWQQAAPANGSTNAQAAPSDSPPAPAPDSSESSDTPTIIQPTE